MLLMVFAIIMSIINLKLYYVCTSLHMKFDNFTYEIWQISHEIHGFHVSGRFHMKSCGLRKIHLKTL